MNWIDVSVVLVLNGPIILYALLWCRDTKSSGDWFLASRSLPWWMVGLSMYATAIDASDMVADSGGAYHFGISLFAINWVGTVIGWVFVAHTIGMTMYREGMYTNAEYLESRFTTSTRIVSAIIQVLYRTVVLGIIGNTVFLTLNVGAGWTAQLAWATVAAIALVATIYTVMGGLRSVAVTDALQSFIMLGASLLLFAIIYRHVGGWQGVEAKLQAKDPSLVHRILHVGADQIDTVETAGLAEYQADAVARIFGQNDRITERFDVVTPAWLLSCHFVIVGMAYSIVNHTQSMRMLGSASEWDMKMAIPLAGIIMIVITILNLSMGLMGRAIYDLPGAQADHVFPLLVRDLTVDYASWGVRGIVFAGIIAASFSTYDSIGSTISALLTRDVYARLFVRSQNDAHYLSVGRWLTPVVIFGSFAYIPLLRRDGMMQFYLKVVGAFVVPLLTVYLLGALTRVHRNSATYGLVAGVCYGVLFLLAEPIARTYGYVVLVPPLSNAYAVSPISMCVTAAAMVAASCWHGWESGATRALDHTGWLGTSRQQIKHLEQHRAQSTAVPTVLGVAVALLGIVLCYVVFW